MVVGLRVKDTLRPTILSLVGRLSSFQKLKMYYIYMYTFGDIWSVLCRKVVPFSKRPLLEFPLHNVLLNLTDVMLMIVVLNLIFPVNWRDTRRHTKVAIVSIKQLMQPVHGLLLACLYAHVHLHGYCFHRNNYA